MPQLGLNRQGDEVFVAVFGRTGSGKSSFISRAIGADAGGNDSLPSPPHITRCNPVSLFGKRVVLLETPGFDDVNMSDMDVLKQIALYLSITYEKGYRLHGLVYMHPITDVRAGASTRQHLAMFQQLCGANAMQNVVFATSMWNQLQLSDIAKGISREEELKCSPSLLRPMLDQGAHLRRYHNTGSSAKEILTLLAHKPATTLRIQEELIIDHTDILDTLAAKCLFDGWKDSECGAEGAWR
ncbi:hypothetical protein PHLGIDRAFT_129624 [Phlebiopsis gigantea 11061_1 CR5-6]|uniref:G domain-containing protein n=1 Tax=Phlebiopsis gigantea (strain 11061_1 CR5-6) TaxID=745531 RepID=A0A0C3RTY7_PHLG1|nr:hypothetical protein PHLGIDRAFT_129624 [Phlebiopsis gigantea 11061_1 CR5-6]